MNPLAIIFDEFCKIRFDNPNVISQQSSFEETQRIAQERVDNENAIFFLIQKKVTNKSVFECLEVCVLALRSKKENLAADLLKSYISLIKEYLGSTYEETVENLKLQPDINLDNLSSALRALMIESIDEANKTV